MSNQIKSLAHRHYLVGLFGVRSCSLNIFVLHNCDAMSIDSELFCVLNVHDLADQPDAKLHHDASQLKPKDYHDYFFSNSYAALQVKAGSQSRREIKTNCKLCNLRTCHKRKGAEGDRLLQQFQNSCTVTDNS